MSANKYNNANTDDRKAQLRTAGIDGSRVNDLAAISKFEDLPMDVQTKLKQ